MKRFSLVNLALLVFAGALQFFPAHTEARHFNYYFDGDHSYLKGSIKYTLIGTYLAAFDDFEGVLKFDQNNVEQSSVDLKIKTASIHSKYPALDRIVRSSRLLNSSKYPYISFRSKRIKRVKGGYLVTGEVELNDIKKDLSFVFQFEGPHKEGGEKFIRAHGIWKINRKDFEIIWSRWLDHGGILVGNHITVDWEIKAFR